ncbi:CPBP family intramembrane metalloprotease [Dokdonia sp. Dokd-P16]|uniref:CPBP family intramembrane glutamic endopeptidase n=1 Tax=Dokdonia sp. Dokd-P16 TaxID=2173169 RepID=UPI000D542EF0|nr:CPBP family intramembrane glutamic endopeptidase [Dokdonia sp. Dokd-P16]AWH74711.1 CPBP family intramembrane metalloprotease [Dokdonia sp. Dokd-P16]
MNSKYYVLSEFFVLFVLLPLSLLLPYDFKIKVASVLIGFTYLLVVLFKSGSVSFKVERSINWLSFLKETTIKFIVIAAITALYVHMVQPSSLFCVPLSNPGLWVMILVVYTFLSVWPQEVIYRTFFFNRYDVFFKDKRLLIVVNAIVFAVAHLFLRNTLVIVLTFIGGLLFAYTFKKTRSTTLVSIEHALYGNWLFTVGMGQMLAFPGMEAC